MSKYIQAYEAGVKLAYQSFFDKLAEEPNMSIDPNEQYYDESAGMSIDPSQEPPAEQPPQEATGGEGGGFFDGLGSGIRELYNNYFSSSQAPMYTSTGSEASEYQEPQSVVDGLTGQAQVPIDPSTGMAAAPYPGYQSPQSTMDRLIGNSSQAQAPMDPATGMAAAPYPGGQSPQSTMDRLTGNSSQAQTPLDPSTGMAAAPNTGYSSPYVSPANTVRNLAEATPAQEPEQEGPPAPLNFQAVRGGYGKQLAALRNMKGLSDDDRDVLENSSYRDLAGAMGNRGLRVGDTFDANALITRMRMLRASQDQPGSMSGVDMPTIDIQNRRGRDVNRGSLAAMQQRIQRAGAARPAVGNQPMRSVASPMANTGRMSMPSSLPSSANYGNAGTTGTDGGQSEFQKYLQSGKSYPGGR